MASGTESDATGPEKKNVALRVALATVARQVFPEVKGLSNERLEYLLESELFRELVAYRTIKLETQREVFARMLRVRLGENLLTDALVGRLSLCTGATLEGRRSPGGLEEEEEEEEEAGSPRRNREACPEAVNGLRNGDGSPCLASHHEIDEREPRLSVANGSRRRLRAV